MLVVGSRRIGKTSLLMETSRRLKKTGTTVYFVSLQDLQKAQEVANSILRTVSPREMHTALRRHIGLDETFLGSVLRTVGRTEKKPTLVLDEIGNVIDNNRQDDWRIMGLIREQAHAGRLQIIMSAFQEVFLKQFQNSSGPFMNLTDTLRLGVFSDQDIHDLLIEPLKMWAHISDEDQFVRLDRKSTRLNSSHLGISYAVF